MRWHLESKVGSTMFNNEVLRDEFVGDNYYGNAVSD
jgi:hypothetical protein